MADIGALGAFTDTQQWGLFDENDEPLVDADTVLNVEVQTDAHVSNYPQQDGAFASYNKVQMPTSIKITYAVANGDDSRFDLIDKLDIARRSLKRYLLGMPEYSYPSVNVTHYGFRREIRQGIKLLRVEVWCEEIRVLGSKYVRFGKSVNSQGTKAQGNLDATPIADTSVPWQSKITETPPT
jgi:hypothetical protein